MAVPHLGANLPLSKKKNIAAPIIATDINQKDPPTMSCGNNNLFIYPLSLPKSYLKSKFLSKQSNNIDLINIYFLEVDN